MSAPSTGLPDGVGQAWQDALAAEHEAVFGYGLLGPRLTGSDLTLAVACSTAHEQLRDSLITALADAGLTPVGPLADYPALYPVDTPARARAAALVVEDSCATAWRVLYAAASASGAPRGVPATLRATAQQNLTGAALRGVRWRSIVTPDSPTTAFPGI